MLLHGGFGRSKLNNRIVQRGKNVPRCFQIGKGTVVRFQGKDRCKVFNNLCTQDLRKLTDGQALETFVTDVKGRTFGHGIAFAVDGEAFFLTVPEQGPKLVPHFDRYIIREDAILYDMSNELRFWLFPDRSSVARTFAIATEAVPGPSSAMSIEMHGHAILLVSAPWIGPESILALVPETCNEQAMVERLGSDWVLSNMDQRIGWELSRILSFWPWYGTDLDDRHLPQEIDRDQAAISFNKGCYLGQETIARLDMLGKIQKKLVRLRVDSLDCPKAATPVLAEDKEVGSICSAALEPDTGTYLALAFVKRSHFATGQVLNMDGHKVTVL